VHELKAFDRVNPKPGQSKTVTAQLIAPPSSYDDPAQPGCTAQAGSYVVHAAARSRELRQQMTLRLTS
jgi:Fibronectin type III-like domain